VSAEVEMFRAVIICACLGLAGCTLLTRSKSGDCTEPHEYSRHFDEHITRARAEKRAIVAISKCYPTCDMDFKEGFVQAYVDVALGGNGELPPVPPERYWKVCERDPEGYYEADLWFEGYTAGAQRALGSCWHAHNQVRASGLYCE
jgi:hypothetical protein